MDILNTRLKAQGIPMSNAYCLLTTACCLLPTPYCLLPTPHYLLFTAYSPLPTASPLKAKGRSSSKALLICLPPFFYFPTTFFSTALLSVSLSSGTIPRTMASSG